MKTCKDCRRILPLAQFTKVGARPGGRGTRCYDCFNALKRAENVERAAREGRSFKSPIKDDPASGLRQCRTCETAKPLDDFAKRQRECRACRSIRYAKYRRENAERESERHRRHYAANRETVLAGTKQWAATAKGKESRRLATRRFWNNRSPDEKRAILARDYESRYANTALRRARQRATKTEPVSRATVIARDKATCYLCGRSALTNAEIHLDHVIPLSRGGTHTYENIKVACTSCNYRKSNRLLAGV